MEENSLKEMVERFFNAELSAEEERELCHWLRCNDVPVELRKDKEAIIALCCEPEGIELPDGVVQRLEATLDALEQTKERAFAGQDVATVPQKRLHFTVRMVVSGAVAAAVALLVFFTNVATDETAGATEPSIVCVTVAELPVEYYLDDSEEDTFDNPEDAMRCFKNACGNVMLAINTAKGNKREIENRLEETFEQCKELIKIKI